MSWTRISFTLALTMVGVGQLARAQESNYDHFTFNIGGGYTGTVGQTSGRLDKGGNAQVGAGFNLNQYVGILGTFQFNHLGITGDALGRADQPDGHGRVYTTTIDPVVRFPLGERVHGYVLAGGGWMRRTVEFTQPTLAQVTVFDPWWGYFGPAVIPVNKVLGTYRSDGGAWDVGGGLDVPVGRGHTKLYLEARYIHGFTSGKDTELVPITLGIRW